MLGDTLGDTLGAIEGDVEGDFDGRPDGPTEGFWDGLSVGGARGEMNWTGAGVVVGFFVVGALVGQGHLRSSWR